MARILLIDDEVEICKWMSISLEKAGHEVVFVHDGNEGLEAFRKKEFDLVITDIVMPEMDGMRFILELTKEKKDAKIIAISGGGAIDGERYLSLAQEIGAQKVLQKPFRERDLLFIVNEALGVEGA